MLLLFHATDQDTATKIVTEGFASVAETVHLSSGLPDTEDGLILEVRVKATHDQLTACETTSAGADHHDFAIPAAALDRVVVAIHATRPGDQYWPDYKKLPRRYLTGPRRPPKEVSNVFPAMSLTRMDVWIPTHMAEQWAPAIAAREKIALPAYLANALRQAISMDLMSDAEAAGLVRRFSTIETDGKVVDIAALRSGLALTAGDDE